MLAAVLACAADGFDCLALVKPQFEVGRGAVGKGGVVRDAGAAPRRAGRRSARRRAGSAPPCSATPARGCPGPRATWRASCGWPRGARRRRRATWRRRRARWSREPRGDPAPRPCSPTAAPRRPRRRSQMLIELARERRGRAALRSRGDGQARPRPRPRLDARRAPLDPTSTSASRSAATARSSARCATYAGTGVPVFAINFGEMGFLATVDREDAQAGSARALAGDFEVLSLPGIELIGRARPVAGDQRRLDPPPAGQAGRRPGVLGRRRRGRPGALRRAGGRDAGRLDRLQPRQRRPGDGLGGAGLSWSRSSRRTR